MFYTGIGSRETPMYVFQIFKDIAILLASKDITLRSGGANGADIAFENINEANQLINDTLSLIDSYYTL